VLKHKDLEQQLVDAKLAQASLQITEAKEQGLQEKQMVGFVFDNSGCLMFIFLQLLNEATDAHKKVQQLQEQEVALRAQVGCNFGFRNRL
jgi:hypothetical protein